MDMEGHNHLKMENVHACASAVAISSIERPSVLMSSWKAVTPSASPATWEGEGGDKHLEGGAITT